DVTWIFKTLSACSLCGLTSCFVVLDCSPTTCIRVCPHSATGGDELPYEVQRAQEINRTFGPKGSPEAYDVIFDLHNTTSNMGCTLILESSKDSFNLQMMNYIKVTANRGKYMIAYTLPRHGTVDSRIRLEVGPQPQGVLRSNIFQAMRKASALFSACRSGMEFPSCTVEVFRVLERIDYPRDANGNIIAMVHTNLQSVRDPFKSHYCLLLFQDCDWEPLNPGDPMFQTFDGQTVHYQGSGTVYPTFINEAAYYEKQQAFLTTRRETLVASAIRKA
uniref:Aspartoacylase n=1 Tax=Kryptolebias marmoratus TaxID=37003 RepID=A0A3Q3AIL3_KRYMA